MSWYISILHIICPVQCFLDNFFESDDDYQEEKVVLPAHTYDIYMTITIISMTVILITIVFLLYIGAAGRKVLIQLWKAKHINILDDIEKIIEYLNQAESLDIITATDKQQHMKNLLILLQNKDFYQQIQELYKTQDQNSLNNNQIDTTKVFDLLLGALINKSISNTINVINKQSPLSERLPINNNKNGTFYTESQDVYYTNISKEIITAIYDSLSEILQNDDKELYLSNLFRYVIYYYFEKCMEAKKNKDYTGEQNIEKFIHEKIKKNNNQ